MRDFSRHGLLAALRDLDQMKTELGLDRAVHRANLLLEHDTIELRNHLTRPELTEVTTGLARAERSSKGCIGPWQVSGRRQGTSIGRSGLHGSGYTCRKRTFCALGRRDRAPGTSPAPREPRIFRTEDRPRPQRDPARGLACRTELVGEPELRLRDERRGLGRRARRRDGRRLGR